MTMGKDLGTTILGGIMGAATAAMPVVEMAQGTWDATDIFKLVSAVGMFLFGFITHRGE
jgi:hypothetical protein